MKSLPTGQMERNNVEFDFAKSVVGMIHTAHSEYEALLIEEIDDLVGLAYAHGWRSRREQAGKDARAKIERAWALWQTELDWHEGRALDSLDVPSEPTGYQSRHESEFNGAHTPSHVVFIYRDRQGRRCTQFVCTCEGINRDRNADADQIAKLLNASSVPNGTESSNATGASSPKS